MKFSAAGDLAVAVEVGDEINLSLNTRVRALEYLIQQKALPGVVETVPSYSALLVYYDPAIVGYEALCASIAELGRQAETAVLPPARRIELPCCYDDPDLGFDLAAAAERLELTPNELVALHSAAAYHLYFIGFTPGLPYLLLPERLHIPRLDTPRTKLPPGSVGLGGIQCCIYSVESPGGYWIVGRTPLALYDPGAADPVLLRPGDSVTFRPIGRAEYDDIAARVAERTYTPRIT